MASLSITQIRNYLHIGDYAQTNAEKGRSLEDLICYIFEKIPGIEISRRNTLNTFGTEEIDIAFWNSKNRNGLFFLPDIILVECKNWSSPVGSQEVAYFSQRLQHRGRDFGILIAANGISGNAIDLTQANYEIAMALSKHIRIIVITRNEIELMKDTKYIIKLVKEKLCELAVSGSVFL